jgi:hypothetical protein
MVLEYHGTYRYAVPGTRRRVGTRVLEYSSTSGNQLVAIHVLINILYTYYVHVYHGTYQVRTYGTHVVLEYLPVVACTSVLPYHMVLEYHGTRVPWYTCTIGPYLVPFILVPYGTTRVHCVPMVHVYVLLPWYVYVYHWYQWYGIVHSMVVLLQ